MDELRFEWDDAKAELNRRKHGVTSNEAKTAWDDPNVGVEYDYGHSEVEDRWRILGNPFGEAEAAKRDLHDER